MSIKVKLENVVATIETDALKAYNWLSQEGAKVTADATKIVNAAPKAVAAFAVLIGAVESILQDASTGNVAAAIAQIKTVWPDVKALGVALGIS